MSPFEPADDPAATNALHGALAAEFETHRLLNRAPQLAWGWLHEGELRHSGGHGADATTVFRIASMTKSFTAAAILLLRDEQAIALDEPVARYAPELRQLQLPTRDSPPITLRHLLTMSSGLATDDAWADQHLDMSDAELDALIAAGPTFAAPPGTTMEYSNLGYALLGRVVLRVTARPVQALVSERLLVPLGLRHTVWRREALPTGAVLAPGFVRRGVDFEAIAPLDDGAMAPMGGLFSNVADLSRWMAFLSDAFPARDAPDDGPLCRASRREMQQIARAMEPETRRSRDGRPRTIVGGYGMGLTIAHDAQLGAVVSHSGGLPGYGSNMRWVQGTSTGVVALANVTYAGMAGATAAALELLAGNGAVVRPRGAVSDALRAAAQGIVKLLAHWDDGFAAALFADNVLLDEPRAARVAAAERITAQHGVLSIERIDASTAHAGTVHVRGAIASLRIEVELSPERPPRVQSYQIDERAD